MRLDLVRNFIDDLTKKKTVAWDTATKAFVDGQVKQIEARGEDLRDYSLINDMDRYEYDVEGSKYTVKSHIRLVKTADLEVQGEATS